MKRAAKSMRAKSMRTKLMRATLPLLAGAALAVGLSACGGGQPNITASASFSDVSDLVAGAPVQYANITVGQVQAINLKNDAAQVVMSIQPGAGIPANVIAELRQTTILGEHYVSLVANGAGQGTLRNGAVITKTEFIPGIQQLVQSGASVFGAVNGAQLASIINNGAQGFGGQSVALRQLISDFNNVLAGYASRSTQIQSIIDNLNAFNAQLAPNAAADAQSVSNLAQTTQILAAQSTQFNQVLQSLDDLATQGKSLLDTGLKNTEDQISALSAVAQQLAAHQADLATVLEELPGHNSALAGLVVNNYAQILDDIIVCGIPGGGSGSTADSTCGGAS